MQVLQLQALSCLYHLPRRNSGESVSRTKHRLEKQCLPRSITFSGSTIGCLSLGFSESSLCGGRMLLLAVYKSHGRRKGAFRTEPQAALAEPVTWAIRMCVFYAMIKAGLLGKGQASNGEEGGTSLSSWLKSFTGNDEARTAKERAQATAKWQTSTKGTLVRKLRVNSKQEGRRILGNVCTLLSEDDTFRELSSHKGCQIRRETAHSESVCCHNVRALFDENPTPRLSIEITTFPAGPITSAEYLKAEKLERVLKGGHYI
eukprot:TRINITY_DN5356_c0_g1_i1.p1 TRINITY_DN5356_c0_g1~~TRINITY_DN5356_c0_g1_i1.p1  ORF type:complete len:260 (+),score=30.22 TRINITY_DN5356_c0_g1_i1:174-953(+)